MIQLKQLLMIKFFHIFERFEFNSNRISFSNDSCFQNMNSKDKYYIRNIVLSYLEACLITRDSQKKIQEDITRKRMKVLNTIIESRREAEVQAVYAIQNFVTKLEHPQSK